MEDESEEFMDLFENGVHYIEGGRTTSGFFSVDSVVSYSIFFTLEGEIFFWDNLSVQHVSLKKKKWSNISFYVVF